MAKNNLFLDSLQRAGLRVTSQRRAICDYLAATATHPTPYEVYTAVSATHPDISRATVYNTLKTLQQLGAIVEVSVGAEHTHYDTDATPHINLICLRCNTVHDYHGVVALDALHADLPDELDFQPVAARIDLLGFCPACRRQRRAEIIAQWDEQHATQQNQPSGSHSKLPEDSMQQLFNANEAGPDRQAKRDHNGNQNHDN